MDSTARPRLLPRGEIRVGPTSSSGAREDDPIALSRQLPLRLILQAIAWDASSRR